MNKAADEAERRRRAKARKPPPVRLPAVLPSPLWPEHCPDPGNHLVCPFADDGRHDWMKPHPRPFDHKYACGACGHYDLDDYM